MNLIIFYFEILASHGRIYEDGYLLGYYAM
jgi:hypothetical protein